MISVPDNECERPDIDAELKVVSAYWSSKDYVQRVEVIKASCLNNTFWLLPAGLYLAGLQLNNYLFNLVVLVDRNHIAVFPIKEWTLILQQFQIHLKQTDHHANSKVVPRQPHVSLLMALLAPSFPDKLQQRLNAIRQINQRLTTSFTQG